MIIEAEAKSAAFTANGTSGGVVTVASTAGFYPNARAYLSGTDLSGMEVEIVKILDGFTMAVRQVSNVPNYGFTDVSAYTTAKSATIVQPPQTVITNEFVTYDQYLVQSGQSVNESPISVNESPIDVVGPEASVALTVSVVDASTTLVAGTQYRVFSNVDGYLRVGATATAATGTPVSARTPELMSFAPAGSAAPVVHFVGSGNGTVWFTPVA